MGRQALKVSVDTNVLVRALVDDDLKQSAEARRLLEGATLAAIPMVALCEFAWVLTRGYGFTKDQLALAIRTVTDGENVVTDFPALEAGLAHLERGGDFSDGVVAYDGARLGGDVFVSFDKRAVKLVTELGGRAKAP